MPAKRTTAVGKSFDDVFNEVSKKFDVSTELHPHVDAVSTGNLLIDWQIGVGGFPKGRIVELSGPPSSGKTTCALQHAKVMQDLIIAEDTNKKIVFYDFEHALDEDYATDLGLRLDHPSFRIVRPMSLEHGTDVGLLLQDTGQVALSVWDSIAAMTPQAELDGTMGDNQVALGARLLAKFFRKFAAKVYQQDSIAVFTNHQKEKIDMVRGTTGTTTPGGKAPKFYSSVRLEFTQIGNQRKDRVSPITGEKERITVTTDVKVKVLKNKVAPPFKETVVRSYFGRGFDNLAAAMKILTYHKIVMTSTGYFYFDKKAAHLAHPDMKISGTGRPNIYTEEALLEFGDSHPDWVKQVVAEACKTIESVSGEVDEEANQEEDDSVTFPSLLGDED